MPKKTSILVSFLVWPLLMLALSACSKVTSSEKGGQPSLQDLQKTPLKMSLRQAEIRLPHLKAFSGSTFSGSSLAGLGPIHANQINLAYIPRGGQSVGFSASAATSVNPKFCSSKTLVTKLCQDIIVWNGRDQLTSGGKRDRNANGLYIGRVFVDPKTSSATRVIADVEIMRYISPQKLAIPGKDAMGPTQTYPARLMGAGMTAEGNVAIVYLLGQQIHGITLNKDDLDEPKGSYSSNPVPIASDVNLTKGPASAVPQKGEEFEVVSWTRDSEKIDYCPGNSSFITSGVLSGIDDSLLSFGRGYQLIQALTSSSYNVGQQFSRFSLYNNASSGFQAVSNAAGDPIEELKTLRTNRPCSDYAAFYDNQSKGGARLRLFGALTYSDINLFRFAAINPIKKVRYPSRYFYRGLSSNRKEAHITGLVGLPEGSLAPGGVIARQGAFMGLVTIQGAKRLAQIGRTNSTLGIFAINQIANGGGTIVPKDEDALIYPFPDVQDGVGTPLAINWKGGQYTLLWAKNTLTKLASNGAVASGPTIFDPNIMGPAAGDRMFNFPDGTVGLVSYDTRLINVDKLRLYRVISID